MFAYLTTIEELFLHVSFQVCCVFVFVNVIVIVFVCE